MQRVVDLSRMAYLGMKAGVKMTLEAFKRDVVNLWNNITDTTTKLLTS